MNTEPPAARAREKTPGHWLLARLGKRVLRPGGVGLTRRLLTGLDIGPSDHVVEFAPGLGETAKRTLRRTPASYTAVERDTAAAEVVRRALVGPNLTCVVGGAEDTGLDGDRYDVVYGEAMLSMQSPGRKIKIIREAHRLLKPGGRYGMHELCLVPDDVDEHTRELIASRLTQAIHHNVQPLTSFAWGELLASQGFAVCDTATAPMRLLEPGRLIMDEGLLGALRFGWNVMRDRPSRRRVAAMRAVFRAFRANLGAVMLVAVKGRKENG